MAPDQALTARHLRQVLPRPLRPMPVAGEDCEQRCAPWQLLRELRDASPSREVVDEYNGAAEGFQERHHHEFVTFKPCVQRFGSATPKARAGGQTPWCG